MQKKDLFDLCITHKKRASKLWHYQPFKKKNCTKLNQDIKKKKKTIVSDYLWDDINVQSLQDWRNTVGSWRRAFVSVALARLYDSTWGERRASLPGRLRPRSSPAWAPGGRGTSTSKEDRTNPEREREYSTTAQVIHTADYEEAKSSQSWYLCSGWGSLVVRCRPGWRRDGSGSKRNWCWPEEPTERMTRGYWWSLRKEGTRWESRMGSQRSETCSDFQVILLKK